MFNDNFLKFLSNTVRAFGKPIFLKIPHKTNYSKSVIKKINREREGEEGRKRTVRMKEDVM